MTGCIIAILFLLLLLMLFIKVQIELKIIIKNGKNYSFIIMRIFKGLLKLRFNLSLLPAKKALFKLTIRKTDSDLERHTSAKETMEILTRFISRYKNYKSQLRYLKEKMKVYNFSVLTCIGTGDAASTALVSGCALTLFSQVTYLLREKYCLQNQRLIVIPNFQRPLFDMNIDCIIKFKLGHIIIASLKILIKKLRR